MHDKEKGVSLTRREFLLGAVAVTSGIPGCYKSLPNNPGNVKPKGEQKTGASVNNNPPPTTSPPAKTPQAGKPAKVSDHVLYYEREDAEYEEYRHCFNKRITHSPKIIAVCLNDTGVQEAVKYANYYQLPIAVKSGGHSFEGYCLNSDGMVIVLSKMNSMNYDASSGRFVAGAGCKLGNIYKYLNKHGKLIPAGSCGGVGVAGLTLGGGYGFFSRQHGLTCDHLTRVKMVDGNGKLHNSDDEPELLWACRGGGNGNFGIITELTFDTVAAPQHFTSYRFKFYKLDPKKATDAAQLWFAQMKALPLSCYSAFVLNNKTLTILMTDTNERANAALKGILEKLKAHAHKSYAGKKRPLLKALAIYQGRPDPLYFKNVSAGYYKEFKDIAPVFQDIVATMQKQRGTLLQINTLGGEIGNVKKQGTAAYPHREFNFLGELQVYFNKPSQETKAVKTVQSIQAQFNKAGVTSHYRNYPDIDLPNWQKAYYGDSYTRLQSFKERYDPYDHIRHPQSIKG